MMEAVLIRHAATEYNAERRYTGKRDIPLSAAGEQQAQTAGGIEAVNFAYTSPLLRAKQTAALLFPKARQQAMEGLGEMDLGAFEGRTAFEMEQDPDYRAWVEGGCLGKVPGGESRESFTRRVAEAFVRLVADAEEKNLDRAVLVAHGGTLTALMHLFSGEAADYFSWRPTNCGGWRVWLAAEGFGPGSVFQRYQAVQALDFLR